MMALMALLLLLLAGASGAARLVSQQLSIHEPRSSLAQDRLLRVLLPDTYPSGSFISYAADHQLPTGEYYGFSVTMDVYDLLLTNDQTSLAGVHIFNTGDGAPTSLNSIEIVWHVSPQTYGGDSRAHLAAAWSTKGTQNLCINTNCPVGFQPELGAPIVLGDVIEPVSQPNGVKQNITIKVTKDGASGDWLVHYGFNNCDPTLIGRYPKSLFTGGLADRATNIHIGGMVLARNTGLVPMGSGYLPTNGSMATAASFSNIQVFDQNGHASLLNHDLPAYMSRPDLYSVSPVINGQFSYGGPYRTTT